MSEYHAYYCLSIAGQECTCDPWHKPISGTEIRLAQMEAALKRIAENYEDGQTLSGTDCAEIARKALEP